LSGVDVYELESTSDVWVDVEAAADAIHDAEGELRAGRPAGAFGPSAIAHHIARRPFLPGERGPWVDSQRERLRGILVRALECRGEVYLWNREIPLAVEAAKEAIALEPFRETAHRTLIRAHAALGNAAEAKRAFTRCRELLANGPAISPSSETQRVYRSALGLDHRGARHERPGRRSTAAIDDRHPSVDLETDLRRLLRDLYSIERELGGGGLSRVFLAVEQALGRQVVIKTLPPDRAATLSAERFAREVRLIASLQQANIVPLLSAAVVGGIPYYTMPYVAGASLRPLLSEGTPVPIPRVISILRDVGRALAFAHEHGIVHRDIKPENILISGATAVVTDFGIAKAIEQAQGTVVETRTALTGNACIGTPAYMAPEQIAAEAAIDHRADIYSYGIVAYELLSGRSPFGHADVQAVFAAHLLERPRDIRRMRSDTPSSLADLVMRCVEKAPASRPQTIQELLSVLG
jgi:tRNA A-37 threonylcarbamoyl transferase component Bud32